MLKGNILCIKRVSAIFYSPDTLAKLKGRQGLLCFQVTLCVRWKGENTKAVLKSFEQNHTILSLFTQITI